MCCVQEQLGSPTATAAPATAAPQPPTVALPWEAAMEGPRQLSPRQTAMQQASHRRQLDLMGARLHPGAMAAYLLLVAVAQVSDCHTMS